MYGAVIRPRVLALLAVSLAVVSAYSPRACAALVSVDFNVNNSPTYSGAGVFGSVGDIWNGVKVTTQTKTGSGIALVDSTGAATAAKLAFQTDNGITSNWTSTPMTALFSDAFASFIGLPGQVTLSGLVANSGYDSCFTLPLSAPRLRLPLTVFKSRRSMEAA